MSHVYCCLFVTNRGGGESSSTMTEIASEANPGEFSLDELLLGDAVLGSDTLDEIDSGAVGEGGEDFFRLSAQEWQNRTLLPLKEDLAMWISQLIGKILRKRTRRERPKSAPYLRLKNIQGTTIGNIWKKNFFQKKYF